MLPLSRYSTHASGSPVESVLLDQLQDAVVVGAHGARKMIVNAYGCDRSGSVSMAGGGYAQWSGAGSLFFAPMLHTGARVTSLRLRVYGDGVADFTVGAYVMAPSASLTQICPGGTTYAIANPGLAWADATIDLIDTTLAAGESFLVEIAGNATGLRVLFVELTYHHPLP